MERFTIVDNLPYFVHAGKTYRVELSDPVGYQMGEPVDIKPTGRLLSELEVRAKCKRYSSLIPDEVEETAEEAVKEPPKRRRTKKGGE